MKVYKLEKKQFIRTTIDECWNFFSSPNNLKIITPDYMGFEIIDTVEATMYPGQIIQYYVKPVLNIPLRWVTEITQVKEKYYFIDEQRFGPYKLWHHKHFFTEVEGGIEMCDIIHYALPFGFLGSIVNTIMVKKQLKEIFDYRFKRIEEIFHG